MEVLKESLEVVFVQTSIPHIHPSIRPSILAERCLLFTQRGAGDARQGREGSDRAGRCCAEASVDDLTNGGEKTWPRTRES